MEQPLLNHIELKEYNFSIFGKNDFIRGEIILMNDAFICNRIEGDINVENEKTLIIEPSGHIIGKINGFRIEVHGRVEGEINAKEKIVLHPNSFIVGKVKSKDVEIHPGAIIEGDCHTVH